MNFQINSLLFSDCFNEIVLYSTQREKRIALLLYLFGFLIRFIIRLVVQLSEWFVMWALDFDDLLSTVESRRPVGVVKVINANASTRRHVQELPFTKVNPAM